MQSVIARPPQSLKVRAPQRERLRLRVLQHGKVLLLLMVLLLLWDGQWRFATGTLMLDQMEASDG